MENKLHLVARQFTAGELKPLRTVQEDGEGKTHRRKCSVFFRCPYSPRSFLKTSFEGSASSSGMSPTRFLRASIVARRFSTGMALICCRDNSLAEAPRKREAF